MNMWRGEVSTDEEDEAAQWRHARRYKKDLYQFPDCRDPDHPGCVHCNPEDPEEGEEE